MTTAATFRTEKRNAKGAMIGKGNTCRKEGWLAGRASFTTGGPTAPIHGSLADDHEHDREERQADEAERRFSEAAASLTSAPVILRSCLDGGRQHGRSSMAAAANDNSSDGDPPPAGPVVSLQARAENHDCSGAWPCMVSGAQS